MKTLPTRIAEARKRLSRLPLSTHGWNTAAAAIHTAETALRRAEESIAEAERTLKENV